MIPKQLWAHFEWFPRQPATLVKKRKFLLPPVSIRVLNAPNEGVTVVFYNAVQAKKTTVMAPPYGKTFRRYVQSFASIRQTDGQTD